MTDPRAALAAIGQLPDSEIDIADAALQLARVDAPKADWQSARDHLSDLARDAVRMARDVAPDDADRQAATLAELLNRRHGYAGDQKTYDDVANANLIRVIERRCGLPVSLGILWLHAAQAAGWSACGIDFPGHFLIGVEGADGQCVVDVFAGGRTMTVNDLRTLAERIEGPGARLRPGLMVAMDKRAVLLRLQNNIRLRRQSADDIAGAIACGEDMLRIAPDHAELWREMAVLHAQVDQVAAAVRCLQRFLDIVPQGDAAQRARAAMDQLRARLN